MTVDLMWISIRDKSFSPSCFTPLILCHEDEPYSYLGVWNPELRCFCQIGESFDKCTDMYKKLSVQPTHWMNMPNSINFMGNYKNKNQEEI